MNALIIAYFLSKRERETQGSIFIKIYAGTVDVKERVLAKRNVTFLFTTDEC